jgi:hypothetical protein
MMAFHAQAVVQVIILSPWRKTQGHAEILRRRLPVYPQFVGRNGIEIKFGCAAWSR